MMTGLLVKQRANDLKVRVLAHVTAVPGIKRSVHKNELQLTYVGNASIVEVITLDADRFV